jgi:Spy/CpxP family protein refolding chaperone
MDIFARKRFIGFLIALLVTLNLVLLGMLWIHYLRPPRPGRPPSPERRKAEIAHFLVAELNLTPKQEGSLRALQKQFFARVDAIHREVNDLRRRIIDESFNDPPDTARVEALANKIGPKEAQKEQLLFEHFQEIKKICGPEQKKKFKSLVQELSMAGPPEPPPPPSPGGRGGPHFPRRGHGPGEEEPF